MPTLRMYFEGERVGPKFKRIGEKARSAALFTAAEASAEIITRGQTDITSAPGNWGARWPAGLRADVSRGGGSVRIAVSHKIPYFHVFERGALIQGKPLMWIPLSHWDGGQTRIRDYPGALFKVEREGRPPLLLDWETKEPKYFGKTQVKIPQKFHIIEIVRDVARHLSDIYHGYWKQQ